MKCTLRNDLFETFIHLTTLIIPQYSHILTWGWTIRSDLKASQIGITTEQYRKSYFPNFHRTSAFNIFRLHISNVTILDVSYGYLYFPSLLYIAYAISRHIPCFWVYLVISFSRLLPLVGWNYFQSLLSERATRIVFVYHNMLHN